MNGAELKSALRQMDGHISPEELKRHLAEFGGPLADLQITPNVFASHLVTITGVAYIHGRPYPFGTEFNLRHIKDGEDIMRLANAFLKNFEEAAKEIAAGKAVFKGDMGLH